MGGTKDSARADSRAAHNILPRGEVPNLHGGSERSASACWVGVVKERFDLSDKRTLLVIFVCSE